MTDLERAVSLLRQAHDKLDDANTFRNGNKGGCMWCHTNLGYDANGIIHDKACILLGIRRFLNS